MNKFSQIEQSSLLNLIKGQVLNVVIYKIIGFCCDACM